MPNERSHQVASRDGLIAVTSRSLGERYGNNERWWRERLPELIAAGVVAKVGRSFFGIPSEIDAWLAAGGPAKRSAK